MPTVNFTYALKRFYPDLASMEVQAQNVADVLHSLNQRYPGIKDYLVDEQGRLRQHVNIFIGDKLIKDKLKLTDPVAEGDEVFIMQALSGG
jgi:molybdopterin converting factor small subunit